MHRPINMAELYSGLERMSSRLSAAAAVAINAVLQAASPALPRLCFVPLHPGEAVEIHRDSLFAPAPLYTARIHSGFDACFWIVFERPAADDTAGYTGAAEAQVHLAFDLAESLERFDFFSPITSTCTSEIAELDQDLAREIRAIQRMRPGCSAELHGEQLSLYTPVAVGCSAPDSLHVSALAPLDAPPSDYLRFRMTATEPGTATLVVLSQRAITLKPDSTIRLTRAS